MGLTRVHHIIFFVGFMDLFGVSLILPLVLPVVKGLGISHLAASCVTSLYGAIQLFSSPMVGWWSDVAGRRNVVLVCLLVTAASYIILGATHSLTIIIVARSIAGTFKHSQTICRAVLADITPTDERSRVFGRFNAASSMGFIVGPMLGGHISELQNGFFHVCNLAAITFVINFVLCWLYIPARKVSVQKNKKKRWSWGVGWATEVEWGVLWPMLTIRFFLSFASLVYRSNFSLLISQSFGSSPVVIGYLISFQGVVSGIAGLLTGHVSKFYHNPKKELFHSSILLTMALLGLTLAPSLPFLLMCLVPLCVSTAIIRVSSSAITITLCQPSKVGSVMGVGQSVASVARMVTPLAAGVSQDTSLYGPGLIGASTAGCGALLAGIFAHTHKHKLKTK